MHPGQGPGLSLHDLGETGGSDNVTLLESEMPAHSHAWNASNADANDQSPANEFTAAGVGGITMYAAPASMTQLSPNAIAPVGGSQPHNNMQPYCTFYFCIALQGVYPPRT
jgi:microcystin-dependent protein